MYTHSFARDLPKLETNQAYVNHRTVNYGKVNEGILHISKTEQSTTAAQVDLQSATGLGEGPTTPSKRDKMMGGEDEENPADLCVYTWS